MTLTRLWDVFLPMVAPFERAFGIDEDVCDVLDVANLMLAAPDFQQRIVSGGTASCAAHHRVAAHTPAATMAKTTRI